jgi:hypothetical protein
MRAVYKNLSPKPARAALSRHAFNKHKIVEKEEEEE